MTYTNQTQPDSTDPAARADYDWNGEHYAAKQPTDLSNEVMDIMYVVKNKRLYFVQDGRMAV